MIISRKSPDSVKYKVHDCTGQVIPYVTYFDTDTCEIEMAIFLRNERIMEQEDGELKIVANSEELTDNVREQACLLMQPSQDEQGETKVGYTFVRFKLPGSYATYEGKRLEQTVAKH